ncbi:MAG TPA: VWA domain-containing protein [Acidobacteriota bacterium]|jgi:VWFA-related protein|nr:VWA domain-containing protein [Acidobacteriota bacterium]
MRRLGTSCLALVWVLHFGAGQPETILPKHEMAQSSQTAASEPQRASPKKDRVVRISVNLVRVDAIVTDGKGRQVTDLGANEFEVFEDGRKQKITNLSYVVTGPPGAEKPRDNISEKSTSPVPSVPLRPEQIHRTMALVVDDLGLSFESTAFVRQSLRKFVDEQMQPGDLVAIIRTGAGMGALQQFTSDRRILNAAIERVRFNLAGRGTISAFSPIGNDPVDTAPEVLRARDPRGAAALKDSSEEVNRLREDIFSVGTLGALNFVIRGLKDLPGRKSIVLFSEGFRLFTQEGESNYRILEALRRLTDLANRAAAVIYTIDPRGLQTLSLTAADNVSAMSAAQIETSLSDRRSQLFETQHGLSYLAEQTGGFSIQNSNDISVTRVLEDQKGYYLIGYVPEDVTFKPARGRPQFHRISVKVTRPGLHVRSRSGFYGIADEETAPPSTPARRLLTALTSPFASGDVRLRLTSLFFSDARAGSLVRSLLHINARDLTFTAEPDGWHKVILDVVAVTFGDNGQAVDQISRRYTIRTKDEDYERSLKGGFVYTVNVPVKKPGAYQLRTAVRDDASNRVGSANQFIEVPDIKKGRLALSGIVLSGTPIPLPSAKPQSGSNASPEAARAGAVAASIPEGQMPEIDPQTTPAVRKFHHGSSVDYGYLIYNAHRDGVSKLPQLELQMRLYREEKLQWTGKVTPLNPGTQADWSRVMTGGQLQFGKILQPGQYVLEIAVSDKLAKEKYRTVRQWIDFEIVP